jgi:hydroxyacylglutathione hydrolase
MRCDYREQIFRDCTIYTLTAGDNYIYVLAAKGSAIAIDPGRAAGVWRLLKEKNLSLERILYTHDHFDHVGGNAELKKKTGCQITGPSASAPGADTFLRDNEVIRSTGGIALRVLATPGHGSQHFCYYAEPSGKGQPGMLWSGDLLFVGGCGRLFGQDPAVMWSSLQRIAALPPGTLVYCGHEYTLENYRFAHQLEPDNKRVSRRLEQVQHLLDAGTPTVPSVMAVELQTNPFLRAGDEKMKAVLGMESANDAEVFAALRKQKDHF